MRAALLLCVCAVLAAPPAMAWTKTTLFGHGLWWGKAHWGPMLFHPYAGPQRVRHDQRWEGQAWAPADWIAPHGDAQAMLAALQRAQIVEKLRVRRGVPEVIVGPSYLAMAPRDRARLAATLDEVFAVTAGPPGVFRLMDGDNGAVLGLYTAQGFQGY